MGQTVGKKVLIEEQAFAKMSHDSGAKSAFLKYLASDGIVFSAGKPVNGKNHWNSIDFNGKLEWQPYLVELSSSHDFAYTIGTYQFYWEKTQEKPSEDGHFSSIWKKQPNGDWKVALDIGSPNKNSSKMGSGNKAFPNQKIIEPPNSQSIKVDTVGLKAAVFGADFLLSNNLNKSNIKGKSYSKRAQIFTVPTIKYSFKPLASEAALSGDLAYVYGQVSYPDHQNANYLRVWRKEGRKSWKVVLEIVTD
ncbi:MAG: nuclear transport factor 2 family protein [Bacteroidota bacterium]